ncbi:nucleotide-binding universal stress UspA family protein [Gelidibacter sediminis]|uniref:Nucleotide-binding universal stress UspA family protein n=1 Tax=Gelidibacter sediminis TaxID=1608710 RepID=A0A4R7PZ66_9FLAO|nr:universal stress protein [Gelidibacter sediminis]TDU40325.1 nucleotide-binding universal stress UspA family protein [Gelidibacter sediminis]
MRYHLLVPTDFSENAWSAALYALKLYANKPCTFYFSHAWTFLNSGSRTHISQSYIDPLIEEAKAQLEAVKEKAKQESSNNDHEFETIFSFGSLMDSIEFANKEHNIDLVVMGTKGATGAKKLFLGSNAVTVINRVRRAPLLLVPKKSRYETPKKILFPTAFNRFFGEEIKRVKQLAELHLSSIDILHINKKETLSEIQNSNLESLKTELEDFDLNFNWMSDYNSKAIAITDFIKDNDINILAMINYEHSFIENLVKEPIIKKLGFHSKIPFMIIPRID